MSKIVKAINVMVSNPSLISNVLKGVHSTECFFKYARNHYWSILKSPNGVYYLHYYPGNPKLEHLAKIPDEEWDQHGPHSVSYNSRELATKEATESLSELFAIVNEKVHGMDDVFDDIIGTDDFL